MTPEDAADMVFLALAVYREARGESDDGKTAVAWVFKTRSLTPSWWGKGLMGVLFKPFQVSSLTAPHDPELAVWPTADEAVWVRCLDIAYAVLWGGRVNPAPRANSYYDVSMSPPVWATPERLVKQIGRLKFYAV